jgi:hypothetical protein
MSENSAAGSKERRASQRFCLNMPLRYQVESSEPSLTGGKSRIINMSATGLLFVMDDQLRLNVGDRVKVVITWAAYPVNVGRMLHLSGTVRRIDGRLAAVQFGHYWFGSNPDEWMQ